MFWSGFRGGDRCLCTRQIFVTGYMSPSGSRQPTRLRSRGSLRRTRSVRTTLGNIIAMSPPANLHFLRLRACLFSTCKPAYSQGMHLTGVHLTGVPLTGVHLTGVHPASLPLTGVHPSHGPNDKRVMKRWQQVQAKRLWEKFDEVIVLEEQKRAQGDPYLLGLLERIRNGMASRPKRTWTS